MNGPLLDAFGRTHTNLRISVTDRCNIRCFYCMPNENIQFLPQSNVLTFEEIDRFVDIVAKMGVNKLRLTGGEPLVRRDLPLLVKLLRQNPMIEDIALTTNGVLLAEHASQLKAAGLQRLNISLDTLSEEMFEKISRRKGLEKVLDGIDAAVDCGFEKIRLNAIAISGLTESEVVPLVRFALEKSLELRFIEFMPLDAEQNWDSDQVLSGEKLRHIIESEFGNLVTADRPDPSQPATDFVFSNRPGQIGFINPVSQPFCQTCNRLRLTAEGKVRNCLFSVEEFEVKTLLRDENASDADIAKVVIDCVRQKKAAHGIESSSFQRPDKSMYQIGG